MIRTRRPSSSIESLESRIAPALILVNPIADIVAGLGKTSATVQLSQMFDATVAHPNHTLVTFTSNLDSDPNTAGIQPSTFVMELFDDLAPLTVQNFLSYVKNADLTRDLTGTFFHRAIPGFVIQGGGFDTSDITKHITIGPEVHNEFDAARSNLRGTVAMAKTGLSPNTATSEWFVNLADNSGNLDNQNGGFTVFGQIIQGLDVFDKIAALTRINQGGALTDLPVQNYNSDPDHNPNTPPPKPTADQLIAITGVQVTKPVPGDATGYTFTATVGGTANLLTASVVGTKLHLAYTPGLSGVANVTVHATKGGESIDDTFQVTVQPNLIASIDTDPLQTIIVPGDAGTAIVKITNNAAALLAGNFDVKFYLSKVGGADPNGTILDAGDLLIGQLTNQALSIAGGASTTLSATVRVPEHIAQVEGESYHVIAEVKAATGSSFTQLFTDDDNAIDGKNHALVNQLGVVNVQNVGTRTVGKLSYLEADGDRVVLRLAGNGHGVVSMDGTDVNLAFNGTGLDSVLTAVDKTAGGRVALHNIDITDAVGTVNFAAANINGYITASGGAQTLNLGNLSGDRSLIIGALLPANTTPVSITLLQVADYSIESDQPIGTLTAARWLDAAGADDTITTPRLDVLNVTGDFEANVNIEGRTAMTSFTVGGFFRDATFSSLRANVGTVSLGGMDGAGFFVGTDDRPSVIGDFTKIRSIGSFTVTGLGFAGKAFINSQVAASGIGAISVMRVETTNAAGAFGFVADTITSYTRDGSVPLTNLGAPGVFDSVGNYSVKVL